MCWILIIFAVNVCASEVITGYMHDDNIVAVDYAKNTVGVTGPVNVTPAANESTVSDDVRRTTTDDAVAARRFFCPTQCRCSPLVGHQVWTKLTVNCSGAQFNQTLPAVTQNLSLLLRSCGSQLTELTITNIPFIKLNDGIFCKLSKIRSLDLSGNNLSSLPSNCFTHMSSMTSFAANDNKLRYLQEGVFTNLRQLKTLSLRRNLISFIEPRVFDESANLSSLSNIDLSHNDLYELEPWPLIRAQHRRMMVNLSHNHITNFTNALQWSYNCSSPPIIKTHLDLSYNNIKRITDALVAWDTGGDDPQDMLCVIHPKYSRQHLKETTALWRIFEVTLELKIDYNPLRCNCKDFYLFSLYLFWDMHWLDKVQCTLPNPKTPATLQIRSLVCNETELCPPGCSCIRRPINQSIEISCPPSTLHSLPHQLPYPSKPKRHNAKHPTLYIYRYDLRFGGSSMKYLESRDYLVNTSRLDVSNSQIETITDDAWRALNGIDWVDLSRNRLTTLPGFLRTENITFRSIGLHGNPLSCECDQRWLPTWLKSLGTSLHRPNSVLCHSPAWLNEKAIPLLGSDDFCRNPEKERTLYVVKIVVPTVAGAVILVSACFVIVYRCRVKVFAKFNVHPFDVDECRNEDMAFDAFVCCAWPDDALARAIVDRLEGGSVEEGDRGGYRVCYHSRDFPLGGVILRSIQQSIEYSKRVICVLSGAFLNSEFCMLEFRFAWQWNVEHGRHRLIVVKCPDVDEALAAAERDAVAGVDDVRMFLSTYTYIEHGSDDWWQKLLYAMPINRLPVVNPDFHQQFFAGDNNNNNDEELLLADL